MLREVDLSLISRVAAPEIKRFTCPIADFRGDPVLGVTMTSIWKVRADCT